MSTINTVTIALDEYNTLKDFYKSVNEKGFVVAIDYFFRQERVKITSLTRDDLFVLLEEHRKRLIDFENLNNELYQLREKYKNLGESNQELRIKHEKLKDYNQLCLSEIEQLRQKKSWFYGKI